MPEDFMSFMQTLDAEFSGRLLRVFKGPTWSGCDPSDVGLPQKVLS